MFPWGSTPYGKGVEGGSRYIWNTVAIPLLRSGSNGAFPVGMPCPGGYADKAYSLLCSCDMLYSYATAYEISICKPAEMAVY